MPAGRVCSRTGCPNPAGPRSRCPSCEAEAERIRGTAKTRGYGTAHRTRFRAQVLRRDPVCVLCKRAWSTVADHYPTGRRDLELAGQDPNDPRYGRGLCGPCHSKSTSRAQPGGWHADQVR